MNISLDTLRWEAAQMNNRIIDHYANMNQSQSLITDGIVDCEAYHAASIRLMWILKEPYCDKKGGGGGWSMREGLSVRAMGEKRDSQSTWQPIIYTSWGILNGFTSYEQMPKISEQPSMNAVLRSIAFVNVQKLPAGTRTNNTDIKKAFRMNQELLVQQIETYRPHIVIGGNTLHLFKTALGIQAHEELPYGHFTKNGILYLNTMHPAQTKVSRATYVNQVIQRAKEWKQYYLPLAATP